MTAVANRPSGRPLQELLAGLAAVPAGADVVVTGLSSDSRRVKKNDLFLACRGAQTRGARFIREALDAGAAAVAVDEAPPPAPAAGRRRPAVFQVPGLREKLGLIASRFYGEPSRRLRLTGITGTNGKTSIAYWAARLHSLLADRRPGLIGTLGYGRYPRLRPGPNTTPGPIVVQSLLADFVAKGATAAFMEVSSHALDQGRVNGVDFDVGVFTNLGRDHADYHADRQSYFAAKQKLFSGGALRAAVVNYDDEHGRKILAGLAAGIEPCSYGLMPGGAGAARRKHPIVCGTASAAPRGRVCLDVRSPWGGGRARTAVLGAFNASNLLAVLAVLCLAGFALDEVLEKMHGLGPAPGRMEEIRPPGGPRVIVDYAHTPDALEQALASLKPPRGGRLVCVFGCGGERDRDKRAPMGRAAERLADEVVLTDDNPRGEASGAIIDAILAGMSDRRRVLVEQDRAAAIALALGRAGPDDVVLIAGKGHETYQEIAGARRPFNDSRQVRRCLGAAA